MVYKKEQKPLFVEYCPDDAEKGNRLDYLNPGNKLKGASEVCKRLGIRARIIDAQENYRGHIMEDGCIDWT